ncbi:PilN domain-containing protein [Clostridium sp. CM028]|uniref:PilN domain-containing protein n=1 Tax=unclassified Clostridium TaxID=2614128 RepID=UPI001C6DF03C|nr:MULTISPECIES: PilN domain-containing protein [unclassified Clostridium]MBW9144433.1 PilN domain-containing protein [Clostridium sp. CM027]MBW9149331.1 PilN domain-containing protein [Clostridium sp. CM028]UVE40942.1 PilN domain-containing protein [Clostridium sp. CM027]WLC61610.1 PilN domain-containing protein [Clostridium sp. CM028]
MSELNLIPYELKVKRERKLKAKNYISMGIIVLAILFTIVYVPKLYLNKLISDESDFKTEIADNYEVVQENKKILSDIKNYNLYNNEVDLLIKQKVSVTNKIKNLEKYIPVDVSLTDINYSKGTIMIGGASTNYASISTFAANLQMSVEYPIAKIGNINNSDIKTKGYTFTIEISE